MDFLKVAHEPPLGGPEALLDCCADVISSALCPRSAASFARVSSVDVALCSGLDTFTRAGAV